MANLKELRNRIASVKATQKITRAMQMVAAAKSRRAQAALLASRPYTGRMASLMQQLLSGVADKEELSPLLSGTGKEDTHLLVVCTSERGLCGGFNSSIVRFVREHIAELQKKGRDVKLFCVGSKGLDQLKRNYSDLIVETIQFRDVSTIGFREAELIAERLMTLFNEGCFDVATLFYARFQSVLTQIPTPLQLIPFVANSQDKEEAEERSAETPSLYLYEPNQDRILNVLLPRNLKAQILGALLENGASEQGARMSAMDNATRNADDLIHKQTILYNRTRQALITNELIEIISGAEAL